MEKLRVWPMVASAFVALLLTLTITPAHSASRLVGFSLVALALVMAGIAAAWPAHPRYRYQFNRWVIKRRRAAPRRSQDLIKLPEAPQESQHVVVYK